MLTCQAAKKLIRPDTRGMPDKHAATTCAASFARTTHPGLVPGAASTMLPSTKPLPLLSGTQFAKHEGCDVSMDAATH